MPVGTATALDGMRAVTQSTTLPATNPSGAAIEKGTHRPGCVRSRTRVVIAIDLAGGHLLPLAGRARPWRATAPRQNTTGSSPLDEGTDREREAARPRQGRRSAARPSRAEGQAGAAAAVRRRRRHRRVLDGRWADPRQERTRPVHDGRQRLDLLGLGRHDGGRPGYSMVLTAGHCAIDETNGQFATNWMFIPAFDSAPTYTCSASLPYGCWTAVGAGRPQRVRDRRLVQRPGGHERLGVRDRRAGRQVRDRPARLDVVGSYPIAFSRCRRPGTSSMPSATRPPASTTAGTSSTAPAPSSRTAAPPTRPGHGLQHDRRLVGRAVAVGLRE